MDYKDREHIERIAAMNEHCEEEDGFNTEKGEAFNAGWEAHKAHVGKLVIEAFIDVPTP